jgi:hypothetical protein
VRSSTVGWRHIVAVIFVVFVVLFVVRTSGNGNANETGSPPREIAVGV